MASFSRLSSFGLTFFAMALETVIIISMLVSFGNNDWK
jgi:hypothetical protein